MRHHPYWFRPARLGKTVAFYYPSSWQGWVFTILILLAAIYVFQQIAEQSESSAETLMSFAPWFVGFLLGFDLLCFRTGEYPHWWKGRSWFRK